ncbi:MAG: hypothetical protein FJZ58_07975 [Chlamydiae bacterium]|nr:hypothetical protein [Chlamydiota bacterium]
MITSAQRPTGTSAFYEKIQDFSSTTSEKSSQIWKKTCAAFKTVASHTSQATIDDIFLVGATVIICTVISPHLGMGLLAGLVLISVAFALHAIKVQNKANEVVHQAQATIIQNDLSQQGIPVFNVDGTRVA